MGGGHYLDETRRGCGPPTKIKRDAYIVTGKRKAVRECVTICGGEKKKKGRKRARKALCAPTLMRNTKEISASAQKEEKESERCVRGGTRPARNKPAPTSPTGNRVTAQRKKESPVMDWPVGIRITEKGKRKGKNAWGLGNEREARLKDRSDAVC